MSVGAWRIVKAKHASSAFTGEGARRSGGRWNSPGTRMIYTAGSVSLAMLEMLVHLQEQEALKRYVLFQVSFDDALVETIDRARLPKTWRKSPAPRAVQRIGDDWVAEQRSAVLRVPSVIVPSEWNYLINPAHPDSAKIIIGPRQPVQFDPRLIKSDSAAGDME